ncbi:MAG: hypothetical protein ISP72_04305 [Flavobacteriaceae bacterium]|nr:hypothetical protein [Flavobacteriaceae bacterium]
MEYSTNYSCCRATRSNNVNYNALDGSTIPDASLSLSLSGPRGETSLSTSLLVIENANWNDPSLNRVVITGLDDNVKDGGVPMILVTVNPQSLDTPYDDLEDTDVAFQNLGDDNAGYSITPISNNLLEEGNSATMNYSRCCL